MFARTSQFVFRRPWGSVLKIIINCYEYLSFHTINVLSETCSDSYGNGLNLFILHQQRFYIWRYEMIDCLVFCAVTCIVYLKYSGVDWNPSWESSSRRLVYFARHMYCYMINEWTTLDLCLHTKILTGTNQNKMTLFPRWHKK